MAISKMPARREISILQIKTTTTTLIIIIIKALRFSVSDVTSTPKIS